MAVSLPNPLTGDIESSGDENMDNARRAVRAFYRMKPHLQAFVRVMTGDPLVYIEPTGGAPRTSGKMIYVRVHPSLGEVVAHDRRNCSKRDVYGLKVCRACAVHEEVMVDLYHEIAHVVYNSFQKFNLSDLETIVRQSVTEAEKWGVPRTKIEKIERRLRERPPSTYVELSHLVSPFMPMLLNVVEDARVNALIHVGHPGMSDMFKYNTDAIFREGIKGHDGSVTYWNEQPPNAQAMIGVMVKASGYPLNGYLDPDIEEDLSDAQLTRLCDRVVHTKDAREVYSLCFPILERLRELGYCGPEPKPPTPEAGPGEPDQEDTGGDSDDAGDSDESGSDTTDDDFDDNSGGGDEVDSDEAPTSGDREEEDEFEGGDYDTSKHEYDEDYGDEPEPESDEMEAPSESESGDEGAESEYMDSGGGRAEPDASFYDDPPEGADAGGDPNGGSGGESDDTMEAPESGSSDTADAGDGVSSDASDGTSEEASDSAGGAPGGTGTEGSDTMGEDPEISEEDGTPEAVEALIKLFGGHDEEHEHAHEEEQPHVEIAIIQDEHFDKPSLNVLTVRVMHDGEKQARKFFNAESADTREIDHISEPLIQQCMGPIRVAFSENAKGSMERNRKSGRINARSLAKKVPVHDPRMFQKKRLPGKRDYEVLIGLDVSGSTAYDAINVIKAAAWAQAELLSRIGVPFQMYAHTGSSARLGDQHGYSLDIAEIKAIDESWSSKQKDRLTRLHSASANLDGHTMEFYRKRLERSSAHTKILMYYTDGAMPCENHVEERMILERECRLLAMRPDFEVIGVGIYNDDPSRYGLDTVRIDRVQDVHLVIDELRKRLTKS